MTQQPSDRLRSPCLKRMLSDPDVLQGEAAMLKHQGVSPKETPRLIRAEEIVFEDFFGVIWRLFCHIWSIELKIKQMENAFLFLITF